MPHRHRRQGHHPVHEPLQQAADRHQPRRGRGPAHQGCHQGDPSARNPEGRKGPDCRPALHRGEAASHFTSPPQEPSGQNPGRRGQGGLQQGLQGGRTLAADRPSERPGAILPAAGRRPQGRLDGCGPLGSHLENEGERPACGKEQRLGPHHRGVGNGKGGGGPLHPSEQLTRQRALHPGQLCVHSA